MGALSFSCLMALIRTSRTMLKKWASLPCSQSERKSFPSFTLEYNVCCRFFIYGLYWVSFLLFLVCCEFLSWMGVEFRRLLFLHLLNDYMGFLPFIQLMCYIILIDFRMLNHPCILGGNLTWSWCIILLICYHYWGTWVAQSVKVWLQLRSWSQGPGIKPYNTGLPAQKGICFSPWQLNQSLMSSSTSQPDLNISPKPLETTNTLSVYGLIYLVFHIHRIVYYVAFCAWLLSLSIMFSKFIHIVACIRVSFLFMAE